MAEEVKFDTAIRVTDHTEFESVDFLTEREMCELIHSQPEIFAKTVLEINYTGHEREYAISHNRSLKGKWKARVDFRFSGPNGDIYVECKLPKHIYSESNQAVSQILAYSCLADMFNRKVDRLVLVTTRYNAILGRVIKKFNLPIEVYILSKSHVMKMLPDE